MKRLLAVAGAASLLAGGLSAAAPAVAGTAAPAASTALKWGKCAESDLRQAGAACAMLSVPLNYSDPNGPTIKIAVSRIKHTSSAAKYQGIILTNPGGPGGSGLDLNVFLIAQLQAEGSKADKAAVADYDWIGFDPRGVGSSSPAITCAPYYFNGPRENYNPRTPQILNYWLKRSARYDQKCAAHSAKQAALLDNMTTVDSARDMDSIRAALGQNKISYYGFSYGTYLGQVYSTLFPSHVRRLIMDSNVDPRKVWYQANLDQDIAFNRNIKIWFGWLAQHHSFYHLGNTEKAVEHRWYAEKARLFKHPIQGVVGPDEWTDVFLEAGYFEQTWLEWGSAFANWANTHSKKAGATIVSLYKSVDTPGDDNGFAVYSAVQCTDVQWPTSWAVWSQDNHRVNKDRSVRDLGQRLVQRPVPALARACGVADTHADQRRRHPQCAADRRDARRGHPVRGQPRSAQAVPELGAARRAGRHLPRRLAVWQPVRGQHHRQLPGQRQAAVPQAEREVGQDLQAAAPAGPGREQRQ